MSKYKIGYTVGANNALLILSYTTVKHNNKVKNLYKVECQICKKDSELNGDAIYEVDTQYFSSNKLPCSCSKSPSYSANQWKIIINRKAQSNNHTFIGFENNEYKNQNTKVLLNCNSCGNYWDSCSVTNYIRDRSCPKCANKNRAVNKTTSDFEWISRFRLTGLFPEDNYSFTRIEQTGRLWNVYCNTCGDGKVFVSDRSNLAAGKIPCNCGIGGGFDVDKIGYFYILKVLIENKLSLKYGITNFHKRRLVDHKRTLKTLNATIVSIEIYKGNGEDVLRLESNLKRTIPADNKNIEGFRKEACSINFYESIVEAVKIAGLEKIEKYDIL